MKYEDAAKIGTKVEGFVRCTYVRLHDIVNGYLFSLQHASIAESAGHVYGGNTFDSGYAHPQWGTSDAFQEELEQGSDGAGKLFFDVPVVKAIEPYTAWGGLKMVECHLTDYARGAIKKAIGDNLGSKVKWGVFKVYLKDQVMADGWVRAKKGDRVVMLETYKTDLLKPFRELEVTEDQAQILLGTGNAMLLSNVSEEKLKKIKEKEYCYVISKIQIDYGQWKQDPIDPVYYDRLAEIENPDATFLVKECAIDWFPTDIKSVTITDKDGKLVSLDVALEEARKRLDRAKAILAAAAVTTVV